MNSIKKNVCVRVECECSYGAGHRIYPGHIIGIHRTKTGDPRIRIDSSWVGSETCCSGVGTTACADRDEECYPHGRVTKIFRVCKTCPYKGKKECPKQRVFA